MLWTQERLKNSQQPFLLSVSFLLGACGHRTLWCVNTGLYPLSELSYAGGSQQELHSTSQQHIAQVQMNFW